MKDTKTFEPLRFDFLTYKVHNLLYYYSMIKDEYKHEYYENMVEALKKTQMDSEEKEKLTQKYPELDKII